MTARRLNSILILILVSGAAGLRAQEPLGQGPPWAWGLRANGGTPGRGMGWGRTQPRGGWGMILRTSIRDGRIDHQLVTSLISGPRGDAVKGQAVFVENCSTCHRLHGVGADIAPDLTRGPRHNPIYVLANLSHPSAIVPREYRAFVVTTHDGRVHTGLVVEESDKSITMRDGRDERRVIAREDIDEMRPSEMSLMPDNLIESLGEEQLRDLLSFLRS